MSLDDEDVPLYPGEMVGWRGWQVVDGTLRSVNDPSAMWIPKQEFVGYCDQGKSHKVPWAKCQCGIYATKTMEKLRVNQYHNAGAFGLVSLWGGMIDGGDGYRAEFAYPKRIFLPYLSWKLADALEVYGVPVVLMNPYTARTQGVVI